MIVLTRKKEHYNGLRKYKIYIDGVYQGDIKNGEEKAYIVEQGKHTIHAKMDFFSSNKFELLLCIFGDQ